MRSFERGAVAEQVARDHLVVVGGAVGDARVVVRGAGADAREEDLVAAARSPVLAVAGERGAAVRARVVHARLMLPSLPLAVLRLGAPGTVAGVAERSFDGTPSPTPLTALTL